MKKITYIITTFAFLLISYFSYSENTAIGKRNKAKDIKENISNNNAKNIKLKHIATYKGFQAPTGIAVDSAGKIYVSNWSGGTISQVDAQGKISVFADGMTSPAGLDFDQQGNLYVADYSENAIYRITPAGQRTVFARGLHTPTGISFNQSGNLLVTNRSSNEIVSIDTKGVIRTVAKGMRTPVGVVESHDGSLYVTNYGGGIIRINTSGKLSDFSNAFGRPGVGIDTTLKNNILAADNGDSNVRLLKPDGTTEVIVDNIGGSVALCVHKNKVYIGSWEQGAIYVYSLKE